jgi:Ala-tRNA(Pro) deacylase
MPSISSIYEFLREAHVAYTVVPHRSAFTAQEGAAATHVQRRDWAKVVLCLVDGKPIQAVLPAPLTVNLTRLRDLAGGSEIRFAQEDEIRRPVSECEPGVMPSFGSRYGKSVFVDVALAAELEIVFDAGLHPEAIRMRWADFAASVRPIVGKFAEPPLDHVGEFRLSYRE